MAIPNSSFTELASVTLAKYSSKIFDNVTDHLPVLYYLKQAGNAGTVSVDGGTQILENLEYGENASFQWYSGYDVLSVTPSDVITSAAYDWKQCNANVIFNGREVAINSGKEKIFDLIQTKRKNAEKTITNNMGAALYYAGTESDGKAIGGLQLLVADAPTTGTVGGINRATQSWWRNQIYDLSVETVTISSSTILSSMNGLWRRCVRNSDQPKLVVMGDTYHGYWEAALQANQRFQEAKEANVGFVYQMYKGAKVLYDPNCADERLYMLNTDYLKLKSHKDVNMKVGVARHPTNQDATVIPISWMGNLTSSQSSVLGVMHA